MYSFPPWIRSRFGSFCAIDPELSIMRMMSWSIFETWLSWIAGTNCTETFAVVVSPVLNVRSPLLGAENGETLCVPTGIVTVNSPPGTAAPEARDRKRLKAAIAWREVLRSASYCLAGMTRKIAACMKIRTTRSANNVAMVEATAVESCRRTIRMGESAEGLLAYHDVGFSRELIRRHIGNVEGGIREIREAHALGRAADVLPRDAKDAWNRWKNLRYAAGALMITERFRGELGREERIRALVTKVFYESLLDTLDDIIDSGSYGFAEALALIRHCLAPLTEARFDAGGFQAELEGRLAREHRGLADFLTALVDTSRRNLRSARHASALAREFERIHERWAFGQALTMFQKDPTLDVDAFVRGSDRLPGPDPDLSPIERLSGAISNTAALTLIDACFMERPMTSEAMDEHLAAWFYFDAVLTLISNVMA